MKAKHITRLRAQISTKGYWAERERRLAERVKHWGSFNRWNCNTFFADSHEEYERNVMLYRQNAPRIIKKHDYYLRKCKEHNEKLLELCM